MEASESTLRDLLDREQARIKKGRGSGFEGGGGSEDDNGATPAGGGTGGEPADKQADSSPVTQATRSPKRS